jgi:predicted Rossmann fold flavoprotein
MVYKFDAVILGGGAAGLMCAIEAGRRGRRIAILERADSTGKKILISGGGRCNFTNLHCGPENFYSANPHFAKSALARYEPSDFIALVEKHHIPYHEKTLGQLFCDRSARDIVEMLETECRDAGVQIILNSDIQEVQQADGFIVSTKSGEFHAPAMVVATGGLSIPKLGATSLGYDIARQFELKICETRPALVPLVLGAGDRTHYCDLAGVSAEVEVSTDHQFFREKMLITHRGLSGPAILQISTYWREHAPIRIDLAPGRDATLAIREAKVKNLAAARSALQGFLPKRFAVRWLDFHAPQSWTNRALEELEGQVHKWVVQPAGTEGYEKAEVTAGGVDT